MEEISKHEVQNENQSSKEKPIGNPKGKLECGSANNLNLDVMF